MSPRPCLPVVALLCLPLLGHAQRPSRSGLGCMAGPQAATWRSESVQYKPVPGFVAGVYAPIWAGRRVEIQPELLLSMQGASVEVPDGAMADMTNFSALLPVSLKYFLNMSVNLQAGVQGGYLLHAQSEQTDITDQISTLDMGFNVGLGVGTMAGLDIALRYYSGMSNTLKEDHSIYPSNRTLQLTVGKRFKQFQRGRHRR